MSTTRARHPLNRVLALILLALLFVSLNVIASLGLRGHQLDLTNNKLFTSSTGTRQVLAQLNEPVRLRFFYSRAQASDYPALRVYAERVRSLIQTFEEAAQGRLVVENIEPAPYSEEEDLALAMGLTPLAPNTGAPLYFGIVGTNAADGREIIPFLNPVREQYLEYDLARLIQALSEPGRARVGIMSSLPLLSPGADQAHSQILVQPSLIYKALNESFVLESLPDTLKQIPGGIRVLLIAHPRAMNDETAYAVDQFILHGGRALVFVDPLSERSYEPGLSIPLSSNMDKLLKAWGLHMEAVEVVGDRERALMVRAPANSGESTAIAPIIDYVAWLELKDEDFSKDDLVMQGIDQLNFASAGALIPVAGATTLFSPLIRSSRESMLINVQRLSAQPDPAALLRDFKPSGQNFVVGARISGRITTAFPQGRPVEAAPSTNAPKAEVPQTTAPSNNAIQSPPPSPLVANATSQNKPVFSTDLQNHIEVSRGPANIIVVSDSDHLDDRFWVQSTDSFLGQSFSTPSADNAKFVVSAIENLMGSNALISLRARERANRPFIVVEELRKQAEARYLAQEQKLSADIHDTEARLLQLQGEGQAEESATPLLSRQEQDEIAHFRAELLKTRQALRQIQHNLNKDVEGLGNRLRVANIFFMPLVVALTGIFLIFLSRSRRKRAVKRLERALARREQSDAVSAAVAASPSSVARTDTAPTADLQESAPALGDQPVSATPVPEPTGGEEKSKEQQPSSKGEKAPDEGSAEEISEILIENIIEEDERMPGDEEPDKSDKES